MRHIAILMLAVAPAATQPRFPPKGSAEQRAAYERGQAAQTSFEQMLFVEAGFRPLDAVRAEKRVVKRALFQDPYMMLPVPGVEIERLPNGAITLRVIGRAGTSAPVALPGDAWTRLSSLQGTSLDPKPYVPWNPPAADAPLPPPPPICHGWIVRFGSADETGLGSGSWAECGSKRRQDSAYAIEIARLTVATKATCKFDEANPFWSFNACFSPPSRPQ